MTTDGPGRTAPRSTGDRTARAWWTAWRAHLERPVDAASLAAFRIMFGLLLAWEVVRYFRYGWIERLYVDPTFFFTYPFFDFVAPWPGVGMYVHFLVMGALALCVALGVLYRVAACLFWLAFTYVFLLDKANYLNHFYLISLLGFLLIVIPAHRVASVDRRLFFPDAPDTVPYWSVFLLRAQMFIVYFYAGLAKLNTDWLHGEPIGIWLARRTDFPVIGHLFTSEWMPYAFAWSSLVFDLTVGVLLWWKRTRLLGLTLAAAFHFLNSQLLNIGIFPPLAMAATLIFLEPDWPRRLAGRVTGRPARARRRARKAARVAAGTRLRLPRLESGGKGTAAALVFVHVYLLAQLLIPLRHWLYPGEVSWTEEGHRFAWHMMLREKRADLWVFATDPQTGETWEVQPTRHLTRRQLSKMRTRPDMVLQYAHYVADQAGAGGERRPLVHADVHASLNGRPYQPLIDPWVNLAEVRPSLRPARWIMPLARGPLHSRREPSGN